MLNGIVVLIVDDHRDSQELVQRVLASHGATVLTTDGAIEAIRIVATNPPDVLLSDNGLPEMDGCTLLKMVRELKPQIPAAAVSAFTSADDRRKSVSAGFRFHIPKPINIAELVKAVAILAGRTTQIENMKIGTPSSA
jgi:CheY-like chemotaxis protein